MDKKELTQEQKEEMQKYYSLFLDEILVLDEEQRTEKTIAYNLAYLMIRNK